MAVSTKIPPVAGRKHARCAWEAGSAAHLVLFHHRSSLSNLPLALSVKWFDRQPLGIVLGND